MPMTKTVLTSGALSAGRAALTAGRTAARPDNWRDLPVGPARLLRHTDPAATWVRCAHRRGRHVVPCPVCGQKLRSPGLPSRSSRVAKANSGLVCSRQHVPCRLFACVRQFVYTRAQLGSRWAVDKRTELCCDAPNSIVRQRPGTLSSGRACSRRSARD